MKLSSFASLLVLALALSGCADFVFKPGASPADMQRDELACRDRSEDDAGYQACMKERGYHLAHTDGKLDWTAPSR